MGDVQDVADDIGEIIEMTPKRAAQLFGTFIAACHEKADEIHDSGGDFGMKNWMPLFTSFAPSSNSLRLQMTWRSAFLDTHAGGGAEP